MSYSMSTILNPLKAQTEIKNQTQPPSSRSSRTSLLSKSRDQKLSTAPMERWQACLITSGTVQRGQFAHFLGCLSK
ncbi:hypothetical protein KL920_004352 [Ogataea angusta]|nr:hypothetical protein KL920_004352 [Ogataea angusta]